ncbi:MAG: HAD-IA family hydrolase [Burkholderiales bacterium]|nr:HAD-IA family hydrolase [Burkholderiales bacterium]
MTLQALIFDMDGTLIDTEELHRQAFNAAFLELGLFWDWGPHAYARLLRISGGPDRLRHYVESMRVDAAERKRLLELLPAIHRTKTAIYRDLVAAGRLPLRPGMVQLLTEARAADLRLAIASTSSSENVSALLAATLGAGARPWFEAVVSADMVPNPKPAPDLYQRVLGALHLDAVDCVALEDSENGVRAAKAASLVTVAVPSRWTVEQDLSRADLVIAALDALASPLAEIQSLYKRCRLQSA